MRFKSILLGSLVLPISLPAFAQTAPIAAAPAPQIAQAQTAQRGLEEIVVTAQRREERVQTTPIAVSAFSAQALENQQIDSIQDLSKAVPNLTFLPLTASRSTLQLSLRGGTEQSGGLVTSESAASFYVDDVYRGRLAGSNLELSDVERIEVLRGPQGTLYGRNAFSGAVKIVTRMPGEEIFANAALTYGRFDEIKAQAAVGGPVSDGIGASIAALYRDRGGYADNLALRRDVGREENFAVRGKVTNLGNETFKAVAAFSYLKDENDGPVIIPVSSRVPLPTLAANFISNREYVPLGGGFYNVLSPVEPDGRTEQFVGSLDLTAELGAVTLRSISAYIKTEDGFRFDLTGGRTIAPGVFRSASLDRISDAETDQFSQELQAQGNSFDERLQWILGLYYLHEDSSQIFNDAFTLVPTVPVVFRFLPTTMNTKTNSYAAFAQGTYDITERLSVTAGLRYTKDTKKFDASIQNFFADRATPGVVLVPIQLDPSFKSWTPKFGVDFEVSEDVFVYASASRGFKAGGFNGLAIANPAVFRTVYEPQTVWSYEAGVKASALDNRLRANVTAFHSQFKGLQQTQQIGPGSFATTNVGDARLNGLEAELSAVPIDGLTLFFTLGLMDDKYKRLNPLADAARTGAQRLPLVSKWNYQIGFSYETPVAEGYKLRLGADWKQIGDYFSVVNNLVKSEGWGLLDAQIAVATEDDRWTLVLAGKNLTDKDYFTTSATTDGTSVGEPLSWTISLRWKM
jgi:iron complex outermembrane receptor protein